MKRKSLLFLLLLAVFAPWAAQAQQCEISYNLTDSYGDGWNGGSMVVTDATTSTQLASLTISNGSSLVGTIPVTSGHEITFSYSAGSYAYENSWVFTDIAGTTIWEGSGDGGSQSYTYTAECPTCFPPSDITVTLTPGQGTIATFSWSSDATAWQICFNNDESNLFNVNRPSFTYNGFTPETQYTVKVRTNCDGQYSSWSSPVTFTPTNAYQITVNDGTSTNEYVPIYGYYVDSNTKSQFIIPANVLDNMAYGTITQLTFYASQSSINWGNATFEVYMSETAETTVSTLVDWSTMTKVRNAASLSIVNNMMVVVFDTPYEYQGGNLMIGFNQPTTGTYIRSNWYGVSATGASIGGYGSSVSQKNFLPKTTFNYVPAAASDCERPDDLWALDEPTAHEFSFAIEGGSGVYNIELKAGSDDWETYALGFEATIINLTNLEGNTAYQVRVQSVCDDDGGEYPGDPGDLELRGNTSGWKTLSFTTKNPCAAPTNLQVSDITASSATLSWTPGYQETEWTVKYKKSTDSEYTTETVNRNPTLTLRNLDGCTQYNVQIYNCESYLSGNFVTAAGIPFTESFATTSIPAGWTRYTGLLSDVMGGTALTATSSGWNFGTSNGVFDSHTRVNIYSTNCKYWLVTPSMPMENNVQLTFDLALTKYSGTLQAVDPTQQLDDKFIVLVSTDNMATWTILRQWDNAGSEYVYNGIACSATGEAVTIDLSSFAGQDLVVAFYGESTAAGGDNYLHIDNVSIDYIPDCAKPTGLAKANVTAHTVDLSWTSDASGWVVAYKTAEESEFREVNVTANSYTLTNLEPETAYTVKVKANCGGVYSDWSNPVSFTTGIACTAPTGLVSSNITGHGVTMTWNAVEGAMYQCMMIETSFYNEQEGINWCEPFGENTATWNNLDPETNYTFFLRKDCSAAEDGYSQIVTKTFTTTVACPAPTVAVSNITAYTAEVNCTNTDAETFNVKLDTTVVAENVAMPFLLRDLEANTSYNVKVQAICGGEDGVSAWTNGTSFMTAEICPEGMVCIGTGTGTSTYMPINNYYNYSLSEQIYTAAEIGQAGAILSIEFFKAATIEAVKDLNIYMVATNKDEFASNTDWIAVTASDLVYSGTVTFVDNDWTTIELDSPFTYDGTSNVCVVVDNNTGSYKSSTNFRTFNDVKNRTLYYQSDGTNPDPLDPTITASGKTATKNRIRLAIGEPPACPKPTGLAVNYAGGLTATVTWEGESTSYNIDVNGTVTEGVTSPYTLEGLELATTYAVMVQANCGEDLSEWTNAVGFTTDECMEPIIINYSLVDSYGDGWNGASITILDENENLVETLTVSSSSNEGTLALCGSYYMFVWNKGSYDSECSWTFTDANGEVLFEGQGGSYNTGDVLYEIDNASCKKPTDLAVNYINGITATVTWEGDATSYNIDVNGTVTENVTSPYTLEGLELATTYNVMVQAVCSAEELSEWTAPVSFTTDLCMPENQCEITFELTDSYGDGWNGAYIEVVDVTTETVLGQFTNTSEAEGGEAQIYTLAVCNGSELQFVWHNGSYDSECSFVIKDLNDEVIVEGISSTLPVNYTVNCTVITCKKPTDLAAFDINKKSVVLSWTPGTEDQNAWRIAYMSENDTIYSYKNVTANPYTLNGLTPETSYTVKVRANCGGGDYSNWSDEISFTTAEACPTEIFNFNVSNITVHNALVTWNGDYDHYQVRYKGGEMTDWSEELTTNSPSIALTGLTAETNYDYQVQGYCADAGAFTDWVSGLGFTTEAICAAPDNLLVIPSITTANISWTGYLASYTVAWGEYSAEGITGNNFMMDNLQPSTTYTAIVTGEGCQEAISASIEFTTGASWNDDNVWAEPGVIEDGVTVVITGEDGEDGVINAGEITVGDGSVIVIEDGAELIFTTEDDQPIPVILTFGDDDEDEDEDEGDGGKDDIIEYGKYRLIAPPTFLSSTQLYLTVDTTHLMDNYYENDLYSFDQSYPAAEWRNYKWTANNFVNLNWKQGYLYSYVTSTGVWPGWAVATANATQNIDLVYDENANFIGANLVGNPFIVTAYPDKPFYVLNNRGTEILSKNVGDNVAVGKGFFVIANEPGQTCAVTTNAPEAKKALNITLSQGRGMIDAAFINFSEIENMRKFQLNPNHTKIYMPFEGKDYAVLQGEELGEMPINFEAEKNGTYTLNFQSSEVEFSYLHLIDNLTGVETNLLKTPAYTFNANVSDYASRFRLVYATGSSISGNGSFGFVNEAGNLCIFGIEGEATLQVIDVTGRVLSSKQFSGSYESKLNVAPGVYMLRLINGNDVKVQKIVME